MFALPSQHTVIATLASLLLSSACLASSMQPTTLALQQAARVELLRETAPASQETAAALAGNGNFRAASAIMAQLVQQSPHNLSYWLNWGDWALAAGKTEQAMYAYQSVLKLQPENSHAHVNLILALAISGQWQQADNLRLMLDPQQPLSAKLRRNLGMAEQKMGNCAAARTNLQAALQQAPQDANSWVALAACQSPADAEQSLRHAIRLQPGWGHPRKLLQGMVQKTSASSH